MLATRLEDPRRLADPRYIAEPKLDGQRAQLHVRAHRTIHAFSRPGRELIRLPGLAWLRSRSVFERAPSSRWLGAGQDQLSLEGEPQRAELDRTDDEIRRPDEIRAQTAAAPASTRSTIRPGTARAETLKVKLEATAADQRSIPRATCAAPAAHGACESSRQGHSVL
jgi:hypothetical protein